MKVYEYIIIALFVVILAALGFFLAGYRPGESTTASIYKSDRCEIDDPDPNGYLLKICDYIKEHEEDIETGRADPEKYGIIDISDGEYFRQEGDRWVTTDAIVVRLDCCGPGDTAYLDTKTEEVIGFSPGIK